MSDQKTCGIFVVSDIPGFGDQLHATPTSGETIFITGALTRDGDSLAQCRKAASEGQPYSVVIVDAASLSAPDVGKILLPLLTEDPHLQALICIGPTAPPLDEIAGQLFPHRRWLFLKQPYLPGEMNQAATFLAHARDQLASGENARRAAQEEHRQLFEQNPIPLYICDHATLKFLDANQAALQLYGYTKNEFLALGIQDIAPPEDVPSFRHRLVKLEPGVGNAGTWRHRPREGKFLEMEITAYPLIPGKTWFCQSLDVTERSNLEAQLRQVQKMDSVGQLASGIAHDFNNLLTVISGHVGMLMAEEPANSKSAESIKEIAAATKRASDLTRQLTTFSRKQPLRLEVADLNEIVSNVAKMLRRIVGEDITLSLDFAPGLPSIKADLGMMEQVLMNLVVNSRDAMPKGGQLVIRGSLAIIEPSRTRPSPVAVAGRYVCLTVTDTGTGIAPENVGRIFEPFFTTKPLGRGTGLGLATVYGIIKQHHGWIQVSSKVDNGTTFQLFLPASQERKVPLVPAPSEQRDISGTETILLVEDELPLLKLMHYILESYGYKVHDSSTGKAALEVWRQHQQNIDLLLTDLVLPDGMTGLDLAKTLHAEKPGLKIIYTSGYDSQRLAEGLTPSSDACFLQKPFHSRKLAETVYDALAAKK
jgi:two-component system, cell cycle sensor histidine kinase and response regulator CckA